MNFILDINIPSPAKKINYQQPIMFVGSCFTEHIGNSLQELKFDTLQNPNGILFDPLSVADSLVSYVQHKHYREEDLIYLNELWQSWKHHSVFSNINREVGLRIINESQDRAHLFLKKAKWLVITLGSSFSYRLVKENAAALNGGSAVANCHRAPAQWFNKHMMAIEEINSVLDNCIHQLFHFNRELEIIFTVSPVRHIRDGVIENNRSKARLIEVVHHLSNKFDKIHYFPAYELVIDVLRDYRFYDIDMVHPNYQATEFVLEKFAQYFIDESSNAIMQEVKKIRIARKHKAFQPDTKAHQQFLEQHLEKVRQLKTKFPFLNFEDELKYFSQGG
ncbi:MAG: GSCFA domain-containing protein [Bacteroidetes bacterium]|nr:GSCFA domain-containing protein [Bacteroidota bacterium]